jgi:hypothetical protein
VKNQSLHDIPANSIRRQTAGLATGRQATTDFVGEHDRLSGFGKDNVLQGKASRISGADFTPEPSPMVSTMEEPTEKSHDLHHEAHPLIPPTWPAPGPFRPAIVSDSQDVRSTAKQILAIGKPRHYVPGRASATLNHQSPYSSSSQTGQGQLAGSLRGLHCPFVLRDRAMQDID